MSATIALFNNKGGVGKTTLAYHLAHMLSRQGLTVLAADLDPQSNLTAMCLDETELEVLWDAPSDLIANGTVPAQLYGTGRTSPRQSIADAVSPIREGLGDIRHAPREHLPQRVRGPSLQCLVSVVQRGSGSAAHDDGLSPRPGRRG
jgi:hypothetical protein